jgi:hypothetical protein
LINNLRNIMERVPFPDDVNPDVVHYKRTMADKSVSEYRRKHPGVAGLWANPAPQHLDTHRETSFAELGECPAEYPSPTSVWDYPRQGKGEIAFIVACLVIAVFALVGVWVGWVV